MLLTAEWLLYWVEMMFIQIEIDHLYLQIDFYATKYFQKLW